MMEASISQILLPEENPTELPSKANYLYHEVRFLDKQKSVLSSKVTLSTDNSRQFETLSEPNKFVKLLKMVKSMRSNRSSFVRLEKTSLARLKIMYLSKIKRLQEHKINLEEAQTSTMKLIILVQS